MSYSFEIGNGRTKLTYTLTYHGKDLHIHIDGGVSHIGSVTTWDGEKLTTMSFPTHMEHFLTNELGASLKEFISANMVITAGVHLDDITKDEIGCILDENAKAVEVIREIVISG